MKSYRLLFLAFIQVHLVFGQDNATIKTGLPTILPPSPTVAALMKFEEVPVSNYTGVPDISIPLFNTPTLSKDINLDISLKYHISGIAADERASDVGLGWSLFAGGTISRTVRGLPDEFLKITGGNSDVYGTGKYGIYENYTTINIPSSNYYSVLNYIQNGTSSSNDQYKIDEFLWESYQNNKYDSEHDLWQFNFMGYSGRFYIKKNDNNQLEVVPLDDNRLKIVNMYAPDPYNTTNLFIPIGFTVYDEKGYKYIFDVIEESNSSTSTSSDWGGTLPPQNSYATNQMNYNSAFHLSQVYDNNNKLLITLQYNEAYLESTVDKSYTINQHSTLPIDVDIMQVTGGGFCPEGGIANLKKLEPYSSSVVNLRITKTKKIKEIIVNGIAKINFKYNVGREDYNITSNDNSPILNEINISNINDVLIKKYTLEQIYSDVIGKRLMLSKINEFNDDLSISIPYEFFYRNNESHIGYSILKDYWGYFNLVSNCRLVNIKDKDVSPEFSTTDILQKIKYPTGGCTIFDFESNQYSYIGDQPIQNYDENKNNYIHTLENHFSFTYNNTITTINHIAPISEPLHYSATKDQYVVFKPSIYGNTNDRGFKLKKVKNGIETYVTLNCDSSSGCCIDYVLEAGAMYSLSMFWLNPLNEGTESIDVDYSEKKETILQYLYGGGNRIKRIGYFKEDEPQDFYTNNLLDNNQIIQADREKLYDYNFFGESNHSSG